MHRAILAAALALLATPAFADAFVYSGTLGKAGIVVEFAADPAAGGDVAGRYFYTSKGIDIPLDEAKATNGKLALDEQAPCTRDTCTRDTTDYVVKGIRYGAKWELEPNRDGKSLSGKWTANDRSQPIKLSLVGTRPLPDDITTPLGLYDITDRMTYGADPVTENISPYDYLRMQTKLVEAGPVEIDGSSYRYVTDPRTRFQYPRIVSLAGGADPAPGNAYLEAQHWEMNEDALSCESRQYGGLGWDDMIGYAAGTLGGYPDETVEVIDLTPTLLSWTESGSLDCGGPHPWNHHEFRNLDLKTGAKLDLSRIFKGWVPRYGDDVIDIDDARTHPDDFTWGPDDSLVKLVMSHLAETDFDLDDADCGYADLVRNNLAIAFKPGDRVLFSLDGLDNAIEACGGDIWETSLANIQDMLAPTARDYFPSLAN